ncbi:MAG: hypothetical protein HQM11_18580 [SAR324 cluster bacterium]|nr:hypothetical protein [SAR324 cluster bacterium]
MNRNKKTNQIARGWLPLFLIITFVMSLTNCAQEKSFEAPRTTTYTVRKNQDQKDPRSQFDQLAAGLGVETTQYLYDHIGSSQMNSLSYGAGSSNIIQLVNIVGDPNKLVVLVGNDYAEPATGLGVVRILALLNTIDAQMLVKRYDGQYPADSDTIQRLGDVVNGLPAQELDTKIVGLVSAMSVTRSMNANGDTDKIEKLSRLIAHVSDLNKVIGILSLMPATDVTTRLSNILLNVSNTGKLIATVDATSSMNKLVTVIQSVATTSSLASIIDGITIPGAGKLGYVVDSVSSTSALVKLIDGVVVPVRLSELISQMDDGTTWTGQVHGPQTWDGTPSGNASGVIRLVGMVNNLSVDPNPAKLTVVLNSISNMTKLMHLIQDLQDSNDIVALINLLPDPAVETAPAQNLGYVVENVEINAMPRLSSLVDGQRGFGNTGDQSIYLEKVTSLISSLDPAQEGPAKVADLIRGVTNMDKVIDLVYDVTEVANIAHIVNGVNKSSSAWPNNNSVVALVHLLENTADAAKLVTVINDVVPANVTSLINNVAAGSQWSDAQTAHTQATVDDVLAGGKKLVNVVDGTTDSGKLVVLLNGVGNFDNLAELINSLKIASTPRVATLVNEVINVTKLIAVIDDVVSLSDVARLVDEITVGSKLSQFINDTSNVNHVVSLINAVILNPKSTSTDLVGLMNGLEVTDISKVSRLVNDLGGTKDTLVADLLAPFSADASQGIGYAELVTLLHNTQGETQAASLASLLSGVNASLYYRGTTITNREGLVRVLKGGVVYTYAAQNVNFPGLGGSHVATLVNSSTGIQNLTFLINALGLEQVTPLVGCADRVSTPDFNPACTAIGQGW